MNRSKSLGIALASVIVIAAALGLAGFALASAAPHQTPLVCTPVQGQKNTCSLVMATYPDSGEGVHGKSGGPHPDWVTYSNDNVVLPANTTIDMTINQYDSGGSLNNAFFDQIMGTIGGNATIDGKTVTHVDPNNVGHTFTLRGIPGSGSTLFVSVPLPADNNTDNSVVLNGTNYNKPVVVQFSFKTGSKGIYEFNCEFPCGGGREGSFGEAMSTFGYMSGTFTVN
jgi:hypothetical protein